MNIYSFLKKINKIDSPRLKLLGLFFFHITKRRYLGLFFDPVLACNLRCKMCYFSDDEYRKTLKGSMTVEDVEKLADAMFHRALKLQIGCGAEPTLYKELPEIIALAKKKKVPYISITTNGNLLNKNLIIQYIEAGLDEITISMHGVLRETYEYFMQKANYEKFCEILQILSELKSEYDFKIRINYTINEDNLDELGQFFDRFPNLNFDTLQLRPIENIGNSEYNNFDHKKLIENYEIIIAKVKAEAVKRGVLCIAPSYNQLTISEGNNNRAVVVDGAYCYISPKFCWRDDFDYRTETVESYSKKHHLAKKMLWDVFLGPKHLNRRKKSLNYELT